MVASVDGFAAVETVQTVERSANAIENDVVCGDALGASGRVQAD